MTALAAAARDGRRAEYAELRPCGTPEGGTQPATFCYTGELQDAATSAVYLRARWHQPGTGTLLGVDLDLDSTGQAYAYAANNPLSWTDPYGLRPLGMPDAVCGATNGPRPCGGDV